MEMFFNIIPPGGIPNPLQVSADFHLLADLRVYIQKIHLGAAKYFQFLPVQSSQIAENAAGFPESDLRRMRSLLLYRDAEFVPAARLSVERDRKLIKQRSLNHRICTVSFSLQVKPGNLFVFSKRDSLVFLEMRVRGNRPGKKLQYAIFPQALLWQYA